MSNQITINEIVCLYAIHLSLFDFASRTTKNYKMYNVHMACNSISMLQNDCIQAINFHH